MLPEDLEVVEAVRGFYQRLDADREGVPALSLLILGDLGSWRSIGEGIAETAKAHGLPEEDVQREWQTMKATAAGRLGPPGR